MVLVGKAPQSFLLGVPGPPSHKGAEATKIADFLVFFSVSFFFVFFFFHFFRFFFDGFFDSQTYFLFFSTAQSRSSLAQSRSSLQNCVPALREL